MRKQGLMTLEGCRAIKCIIIAYFLLCFTAFTLTCLDLISLVES